MNTIRAIISCASDLPWNLYQLYVKKSLLHGDARRNLHAQTEGNVLKLHGSLYRLKQSPKAWSDRFVGL
jgi:hypothetical protein